MPGVETALVRSILQALELERVRSFRNNTGRRAGVTFGLGKGSPDIVACVGPKGRMLGIECKTPEGKMSAEQKMWAERIRSVGGVYVCCRSVAEAREAVRFAREGTMEDSR